MRATPAPIAQLIHCGGGGAYLYPTHRMPEEIQVPPPANPGSLRSEETKSYRLASRFPTKSQSRRYAFGVFGRVLPNNPGFAGMLGTLQTLLMCAMLGVFEHVGALAERWLELPIALMVILFMAGTILFAKSPTGGKLNGITRIVLGTIHGLVQIGVGVLGTWGLVRLPFLTERWPLPIAAVLGYFLVMGAVSTVIFCAYMLIASAFGVNVNELFSGQSIIDSKSFLRLHIDRHGTLTVHPIAVPKVSRKWRATPDAPEHKPWLEPARPIGYRLAEPPITIAQRSHAPAPAPRAPESQPS